MRVIRFILLFLIAASFLACGGSKAKDDNYADKMAVEHEGDKPVANAATDDSDPPALHSESKTVVYHTQDSKEISGYFFTPVSDVKGSVIVIHEWWGLNDNIRAMAGKLAGEGYRVLAVDLYQGESASEPERAKSLMMTAMKDKDAAVANLKAAHAFLTQQGEGKVAVMGWCFGGHWSLQAALAMPNNIAATVIYYGKLVDDEKALSTLNMPILGIFGSEDKGIPVADVKKFETTMTKLKKDASIHIYDGADHAFANPSGTRYQKDAAEDAWAKTITFLDTNLK